MPLDLFLRMMTFLLLNQIPAYGCFPVEPLTQQTLVLSSLLKSDQYSNAKCSLSTNVIARFIRARSGLDCFVQQVMAIIKTNEKKVRMGRPFSRAVRTEERMICLPNFGRRSFQPVSRVLLLQLCLFSAKVKANGYLTLVTDTLDSFLFLFFFLQK